MAPTVSEVAETTAAHAVPQTLGGMRSFVERLTEVVGGQLIRHSRRRLPDYLDALARALTNAFGGGALLLALDDGRPLGYGCQGLGEDVQRAIRARLDDLRADRDRPGDPLPGPPAPGGSEAVAALRNGAERVGYLAWIPCSPAAEPLRDLLEGFARQLSLAVAVGVETERWQRVERLQSLLHRALEGIERQRVSDRLDDVVQELSDVFGTDVATVLLASDDELRLAASTDRLLREGPPVVYRLGEGLTGWIFETGTALRIDDTADTSEVRRVTGLERYAARFPERDARGLITGQFLGVPMRCGGRVVGVIRISRRQGARQFTRSDQDSLHQFADLLGAGLSQTFHLQLADSVLHSVHDAIAVSRREVGKDGTKATRIALVNPGGERLLGQRQEDLVGLDARVIYAPGEYEKVRQSLRQVANGLGTADSCESEPVSCLLQRADGSTVAAVVSYRLLVDRRVRPPALYTVGVAREASSSEAMAGRYRRLLEFLSAMDIAYFRADSSGVTVESTPADARITGYLDPVIQKLNRHLLHPDRRDRQQFLDIARKSQGRVSRIARQLRRENGELFWAEGDLRILTDADGTEIGVEGIYRDVTERMRLQHFLNEETDELLSDHELFTRLKQDAEFHLDYLSSVGHQILTPLSSLAGTLRNFEEGVLDERELRERLPWVAGQVRVCARLVRNLSFMDKILRGERFERRSQGLARLAIETKLDFDHLLDEKRLKLRIDSDSLDRLGQVDAHRDLLRQVFVNLVDNAVKYSTPGSTIVIRGQVWPAGRVIEVSNQGLPISKENRTRVFDRGFRTPQARAHVPHGTGFGLWLVRKILAAHDAQIACAEDNDEAGSRVVFRITFPHAAPGRRGRRTK